jgi:hypothetical protein
MAAMVSFSAAGAVATDLPLATWTSLVPTMISRWVGCPWRTKESDEISARVVGFHQLSMAEDYLVGVDLRQTMEGLSVSGRDDQGSV